MSTQSKKCHVAFYSTNGVSLVLEGITPEHYSTVHLTNNVIVAVGRGGTDSLVEIKVGTIVEITQTDSGIVATFGEFNVPITKSNLRDLESYADRQDCFVSLEDGGFTKSLHFRHPVHVVYAMRRSPVPTLRLEEVAHQLGFEL